MPADPILGWPSASLDDATVVTATRRLSRHLRQEHDRFQVDSGKAAWESADILPWDAWVDRSWQTLRGRIRPRDAGTAISEAQEAIVWELAARDSGTLLDRLLLPAEIAQEARRAWELVHAYRVSIAEMSALAGAETRQLLDMAAAVEKRLRDEGWIVARKRLADITASPNLADVAPKHLVLAGYDELTPAQRALVEALRGAGTAVQELPVPRRHGSTVVRSCPDPRAELEQAAAAARRWLDARPDAQIGVVLADLEQRKDELEDIFDDILTPSRILPGRLSDPRAWNVSLGSPLADWPMIDDALRALSLLMRSGDYTEIGLFLRSPFMGDARSEAGARGRLDRDLRAANIEHMDLPGLGAHLHSRSENPTPLLAARLHRLVEAAGTMPKFAEPERWAGLFGELLNVLGWPGDRPLDSAEYQCRLKWQQLLETLASTGRITGRVSGPVCLDRLRRLATETPFQPEGNPAPVQVLGLLETAGMSFDALWIAGLHHQAWPRPLRPNALIPTSLQRRHRMPRADPELELEFARRRTHALAHAGTDVVFSWPEKIDDEKLRPSPLFGDLPTASTDAAPRTAMAHQMLGGTELQCLSDYRLRPWPPGASVRGGSGVVKAQAACPFQAQARVRLGAESLEQPRPGITPLDRGRITHLALQALWETWGGNERLSRIGDEDVRVQVEAAVAEACRRVLGRNESADGATVALEIARTVERVLALLDQDRNRGSFEVEHLEWGIEGAFGDVGFRLRVDRVDRLANGSRLLIDYKTGAVRLRDWDGERLRDPQLPLYALMGREGDAGVDGLAYGCLRVGEEGYSGFAASEVPATGIRDIAEARNAPNNASDWPAALAEWRRHIERLVREFAAGDARVDPRRMSEDCRYCDLSSLCRRHELISAGVISDE